VARGQTLHDGREDRPGAAVGVALGLLLDLPDRASLLVAQLVLELAEQDLLGLGRRQARDALQLPQLAGTGLLQLHRGDVEVALAVVEPRLAVADLREPRVDGGLLGMQALLLTRDLGPAG
jgi:hypothetical protein